MKSLSKNDFEALARVHDARCFSFFVPTHRVGREVLKKEDQLVFKHQLALAEQELESSGVDKAEIQEFLEPASNLLLDDDFWRHHIGEGLALFLSNDLFRYFDLPIPFEPFHYHSHEFYLKPLLPVLVGDGNYYLLTLNFHEVKFYRGKRFGLKEIHLEHQLPQQLEEVVGTDYNENFLGYHAQKRGGHSNAIFHGHGDWKEDEKEEILHFFRAVDKSIAQVLHGRNEILLVACLDYLFPIYKEANTYPHLYEEAILGNPAHLATAELHNRAWDMLQPYFDKKRQQKAALLAQLHDTDRTETDIKEAIPAAMAGKIDALFLERDAEIWGICTPHNASVTVQGAHSLANTSLTNMLAVQVYLNGGDVYLENRENLPLPYAPVNVLYRY